MSAHASDLSGMRTPRAAADWAWRRNRPLAAFVAMMLAVAAVAIVGLIIDPRIITGAPAWMKPLKFAISFVIYGATLLWLLTFIPDRPRLVAVLSWAAVLGFGAEMALIVMQVLRGTTSHFNYATPFDAAVFTAMAGIIAAMWLLNAVVVVLLARRHFALPPIAWGARLGLVAALIGMAVAFLMPQPTPAQKMLMDDTGASPIMGAHAVGVVDGGPGLPVVGWSTSGGDLRVAHFVGLHALQGLPLLGWLLVRFAPAWLTMRDRARLVVVAGLWWIALIGLLTWQALRAQPLIAPDRLMLTAFGATLAVAAISAGAVIAWARRRSSGEGGSVTESAGPAVA